MHTSDNAGIVCSVLLAGAAIYHQGKRAVDTYQAIVSHDSSSPELPPIETANLREKALEVQRVPQDAPDINAETPESAEPMTDPVHEQYVEFAEKSLSVYRDEDQNARVTDCLTNLMHWCDRHGIDFKVSLARAEMHHRTEVNWGREQEHEEEHELSR
jgi:hypothetical protein